MRSPFLAGIGVLLCGASAHAAVGNPTVTVDAGAYDRRDTIVTFILAKSAAQPRALRRDGRLMSLQVERDGRASFLLEALKQRSRAVFEIVEAAPGADAAGVSAARDAAKLKLTDGGRTRLEYQAEAGDLPRDNIKPIFARGGYLHPMLTPAGKVVTDDFPPNHIHHHGIWWAWTLTEFQGRKPDFWNLADGKGRVEFVALDESWSGPVHGGFRARHRFVDLLAPQPVTALNETWEVRIYATPGRAKTWWMFDLASDQHCATTDALKLPENRYGGIGLRGNWAWNGKDAVRFLTSEGETDRVKGHATRARWCDMWGELGGGPAGIAMLCHPANFRAPQPMRIHPTEPFFNYAPQQAGDMEIKPGQTYASRYRFVVHDGPPDRVELDRLWNDYAHPPEVRVSTE